MSRRFFRKKKLLLILTFIGVCLLMSSYSQNSQNNDPKSAEYEKTLNSEIKSNELKGLDSYLKNISDQQEKNTLVVTLQFMREEREAEDEELVNFVRGLIRNPSADSERNLFEKDSTRTDFSQIGQSKYIDGLLDHQRDGFYVEAGAVDGEELSNSLFFELTRNWGGILIEPLKRNYKLLMDRKRRAYTLNACISDRVQITEFISFSDSYLAGVADTMSEQQRRRGKSEEILFVPCFSLVTILKAINVNKVDYFSLDVEGKKLLLVLRYVSFYFTNIHFSRWRNLYS